MRYSEIVHPPKRGVRRATAEAMLEHRGVFEKLLSEGLISPVNPGDSVELFDVEEIRSAWNTYRDTLRGKVTSAAPAH